jgi:site-specific DNA recombinase
LHKAIIDEETWQKAQDLLTNKTPKVQAPNSRISQASLLKGVMNCGICGSQMTPTYISKQGKKYLYYICQAKFKGNNEQCQVGRIPANQTEELVTNQVLNILQKPEIISSAIKNKNEQIPDNEIIN